MKKIWRTFFLCFVFFALGVAARASDRIVALSDDPSSYTGWWWEGESRTGTGISIEVQDGRLYLAWYVYDPAGRPVWYSALMEGVSGVFAGDLFRYSGWPLETNSPETGYAGQQVGTVRLVFNTLDEATLIYKDSEEFSISISRFLSGTADTRNIQGWWWNPAYQGMGVFIESRGGQLFAAWYNYRNDNSPRWWISIGEFSGEDEEYSGEMFQYAGGQTLTGEWALPILDAAMGQVSIQFEGETASLQWQGFSYQLERFAFGREETLRLVPDTGIVKCYDYDYFLPVCSFPGGNLYGQDANYNSPARQPAYKDNADGTVTDLVTGLMWVQADNGNTYSWQESIGYCQDLDFAGHSDWRLPDRHELVGLIYFATTYNDLFYMPAIQPDFFTGDFLYWSMNQVAGKPGYSWIVSFDGGGGTAEGLRNETHSVRCVR